jgi:hypothetical protein
MLFIHAMGLQAGRMVSGSAAGSRAQTEVTAHGRANIENDAPGNGRGERPAPAVQGRRGEGGNAQAAPRTHGGGGRTPAIGLADIQIGSTARQWVTVSSLLLVYGSYLILRIRKAKRKFKKS